MDRDIGSKIKSMNSREHAAAFGSRLGRSKEHGLFQNETGSSCKTLAKQAKPLAVQAQLDACTSSPLIARAQLVYQHRSHGATALCEIAAERGNAKPLSETLQKPAETRRSDTHRTAPLEDYHGAAYRTTKKQKAAEKARRKAEFEAKRAPRRATHPKKNSSPKLREGNSRRSSARTRRPRRTPSPKLTSRRRRPSNDRRRSSAT